MAYGAPTDLDLSACTLSTDGGKTNQTLAALGTSVASNASALVTVQTAVTGVEEDAKEAKDAVSNLGTTYIPQTSFMTANGVPKLDKNGQFCTPPNIGGYSWISLGGYVLNSDGSTAADTTCRMVRIQQSVTPSGGPPISVTINTWANNSKAWIAYNADTLHPDADGGSSLGSADHAWANIYSKTSVQVTSDMTQKTLMGQVGADNFTEAATLAKAISSVATIGYKLNDAIAAKGAAEARIHFGYSAQDIWSAIVGAGLDPSKYALITKSPVYVVQDTPTDKKQSDGTPITTRTVTPELDADGNQVYRLMLRYDQVYALLLWYQAQQQSALESRIVALETKANAATSGSAS